MSFNMNPVSNLIKDSSEENSDQIKNCFEEIDSITAKARQESAAIADRLKACTEELHAESLKLLDDLLNTPASEFNDPKVCKEFENRSSNKTSEIATRHGFSKSNNSI